MKRFLLPFFLFFLSMLVSCAGFTPIYAEKSAARIAFSEVQINPISGREGFVFTQEILERGGITSGESGKYQLQVKLTPARRGFGIQVDNVATRFQVQMTANWSLLDENGKTLTSKTSTSTTSFDSGTSPYASQVAETDAENRAISILADTILDQLGHYFLRADKNT
ncbi:MAG: LPS assembly lipoprotein LptE [Robiginitomaculum sp.]|nr:LPS assembly lipoprotein LptE [Robiginitomaculum sp.]